MVYIYWLIQLIILIVSIISIIHIINITGIDKTKVIKKPKVTDTLSKHQCEFESDNNVYDFKGNIKGKKDLIPCAECNQYVWKKDDTCGLFEYDTTYTSQLADEDIRTCTEYPISSGECPFK